MLVFLVPMPPELEADDDGLVTVRAPPGPLGLVLQSEEGGPVVRTVSPASPVAMIRPGMVLRSVDGEDVSSLSSDAAAKVLLAHAEQPERVLVLAMPPTFNWGLVCVGCVLFLLLLVACLIFGFVYLRNSQEASAAVVTGKAQEVGIKLVARGFDRDFVRKVIVPGMGAKAV